MVMRSLLIVAGLCLCACQADLTETAELPVLDRPFFDCRVQPVLTKYCAVNACHGTAKRYFYIFARNRLRLGGAEDERNAFMRASERDFNYAASLGFVVPGHPEESLLALKPLEQRAGGYFHVGATIFGDMDVFASTDDNDYQVLADWINGATEDPNCVEPGSDL